MNSPEPGRNGRMVAVAALYAVMVMAVVVATVIFIAVKTTGDPGTSALYWLIAPFLIPAIGAIVAAESIAPPRDSALLPIRVSMAGLAAILPLAIIIVPTIDSSPDRERAEEDRRETTTIDGFTVLAEGTNHPYRIVSSADNRSSTDTGNPSDGGNEDNRSSSQSEGMLYRVTRVVDGDTVEVENGDKEIVRVIGIDTPETVHPREAVECRGPQAAARAKRLLEGRDVWLTLDPTQGTRDKYGRLLTYIDIPDRGDFGKRMIRDGLAIEYTYSVPYQRRPEYVAAEDAAKAADRGLWSACESPREPRDTQPTQSPQPTPDPAPEPAPQPQPQPEREPERERERERDEPPAWAQSNSPGLGWTNDHLTPGYTGCRQGYPGGRINGVYWWKPIPC